MMIDLASPGEWAIRGELLKFNCIFFSIWQFKHMFCVLKTTVSVVLSTHNICFEWEIRNLDLIIHSYLEAFVVSPTVPRWMIF